MVEKRVVGLTERAGPVLSDHKALIDHEVYGTQKVGPDALVTGGILFLEGLGGGSAMGAYIVASVNGQVGLIPFSDASGGLLESLRDQLQSLVDGVALDAQNYALSAQQAAADADAWANAQEGTEIEPGKQSGRSYATLAGRNAAAAAVLPYKEVLDADFDAATKSYTLQPGDLAHELLLKNTITPARIIAPKDLFNGTAADGGLGYAWVQVTRLGAAFADPPVVAQGGGGGGGGGGGATPVAYHKGVGDQGYRVATLPVVFPTITFTLAAVPSGSNRRLLVALVCAYNNAKPTGRTTPVTAKLGAATVALTKIVAETSTGGFAASSTDPLCLTVFEGTLPDTTDARDVVVTFAPSEAIYVADPYVAVVKDVGSAGTVVGDSDGATLLAQVANTLTAADKGLALFGAWGQGAGAGPMVLTGAGTAVSTAKTVGSTALKDVSHQFGWVATTGAAQTATQKFAQASKWARFVRTYLPAPPAGGGATPVTVVAGGGGGLSAVGKSATIKALGNGVDYIVSA